MKKDVIYRQDAIDAFKKELTVGESKGNYVTICSAIGYEGAKQILERLPPARTEVTEEVVKDYCRKRSLTILTNDYFHKLTSAQPESAQWVQMFINPNLYKCSNCQVAWNKRFVFDNEGYSENIFMKYCPCCGRKMKTKVDYE